MMKGETDYQRLNRSAIPVTVTMSTGVNMRGTLYVSKTRTLQEELNRTEQFIEFEPLEGARMFLSRSVIAAVKEYNVPKADQLSRRSTQIEQFDAHEVLGLPKTADAAAIRNAYVAMAKTYHPDKFVRVDLPAEVAEYLSAVATRINLAYAELRMTGNAAAHAAAEQAA